MEKINDLSHTFLDLFWSVHVEGTDVDTVERDVAIKGLHSQVVILEEISLADYTKATELCSQGPSLLKEITAQKLTTTSTPSLFVAHMMPSLHSALRLEDV